MAATNVVAVVNALDDVLEVGASFAVVVVNALTCEVFFSR